MKLQAQLCALGDINQIKQEREELAAIKLQVAELQNELASKTLEYSKKLEEERGRVFSVIEMLASQK